MKLIRLPEGLRSELRRGFGVVVSGDDYLSVALRVVTIIGSCSRVWAVGDVVCSSLVGVGCVPKVCFIDGKTLRSVSINVDDMVKVFNEVLRIRNPAGTISEEAINAVKYCSSRDGVLVVVDGEEDLIGLAVILYANIGDYLVYGLPKVGVDVVRVDTQIKGVISEIVSRFETIVNTNSDYTFRQTLNA